ncbi:hypothetical protein ACIP6X_08480 [Streptomyces coeruleorubidus]|uniref:hypothetical protein n=1 Tax=Streptomyces coeruleorubidus TaxID=116188 RepID=UPI0038036CAD
MTPAADQTPASPECTLAARPGYQDLHTDCRQTRDLPLPFAFGILLQPRCGCPCHSYGRGRQPQNADAPCPMTRAGGVRNNPRQPPT